MNPEQRRGQSPLLGMRPFSESVQERSVTELSMREATKAVFHDMEPQESGVDGKSKTWIVRGGNFAICYSEVASGAVLERANDPEEHMVILPPDGTAATLEAGSETVAAGPDSLTIMPP